MGTTDLASPPSFLEPPSTLSVPGSLRLSPSPLAHSPRRRPPREWQGPRRCTVPHMQASSSDSTLAGWSRSLPPRRPTLAAESRCVPPLSRTRRASLASRAPRPAACCLAAQGLALVESSPAQLAVKSAGRQALNAPTSSFASTSLDSSSCPHSTSARPWQSAPALPTLHPPRRARACTSARRAPVSYTHLTLPTIYSV